MRHARQSGFRRQVHHAANRHFHRHVNRDHVKTVDHRVAQGYGLHRILVAHVSRRVFLIVVSESFRLVFVNSRRRDQARYGIVGGIQRGRIYERFES